MADFTRRKINPKTLGEILKAARKKKELSLDQVEEETKVRAKYLKALEEERFDDLPGNVYALGFLNKYIDFLELNKSQLINLFKLERGAEKDTDKILVKRQIKDFTFSITPKNLTATAVILAVLGIIFYIVFSVRNFTIPPNLQISSPSDQQIIASNEVFITGKTDEGSSLTINGQAVLIDGNGNFNQKVKLNEGLNTFEVISINQLKKETVKEVKILAKF